MTPQKSASGVHNWKAMDKRELKAELKSRGLSSDSDDKIIDLMVRLTADDLDMPETTKFHSRAKVLWDIGLEELKKIASESGLLVKRNNIFRLVGIILIHEFGKGKKTKAPRNIKIQPAAPVCIEIEDDEVVENPPPRNTRQRPAARAYVEVEEVSMPPVKRKLKLPDQMLFAVITSATTLDRNVNVLSDYIAREKDDPEREENILKLQELWGKCKDKLGEVMGSIEGSAYIEREMAEMLRGSALF